MAAAYALLISALLYRSVSMKGIYHSLVTSARVTVSIGCAEALQDETDMAMLFRRADAALLQAKGAGRAQVRFQAPVGDV